MTKCIYEQNDQEWLWPSLSQGDGNLRRNWEGPVKPTTPKPKEWKFVQET